MRIAICDDDKGLCEKLESLFDKYRIVSQFNYVIDIFYSAEDLLKSMKEKNPYDMILLDIYMGDISGVEAGKILRQNDDNINTEIVYISSSRDFFEEVIGMRVFDYIIKPITEKDFNRLFNNIQRYYKSNSQIFNFKQKGKDKFIQLSSILYFEINNRKVVINRKESSTSFKVVQDEYYSTMKDLREEIKDLKFALPHRSYLVNCMYIEEFRQKQIKMRNGDIIPVSQTYREEAIKRWVEWMKLNNICNLGRGNDD